MQMLMHTPVSSDSDVHSTLCRCERSLSSVANSCKTHKQLQLQKQAQHFYHFFMIINVIF